MIAPCYECQERHIGCHAGCERYAEYAAVVETERDARNARKGADRAAIGFRMDAIRRTVKQKGEKFR